MIIEQECVLYDNSIADVYMYKKMWYLCTKKCKYTRKAYEKHLV